MANGYEDLVWPDPPDTVELEPMSVTPGAPPREPAKSPGIAARLNEEAAARRAAEAEGSTAELFTAPDYAAPTGIDPQVSEELSWPEPPADVEPIVVPESIEGDPTWGDYGRMVMSGGASVGAGVGWILEKLGAEDVGGTIKQVSLDAAESWTEDLTPVARAALQQELLGESITGDAKFNKIKLLAAGSLLGTMAGAGMGSVMTKGLQMAGVGGRTAATIGFGAGEASVAAPAAGAYTQQEVMEMPLEQLAQGLEFQAAMLSFRGDMDNEEHVARARELVARAAGGEAASIAAITTFALSAPFGRVLDKLYAGGGATSATVGGRALGAGKGGLTEASQEFLQSGSEKFAENIAMFNVDPTMGPEDFARGVLEEALAGAGAGFTMGAPMGVRLTEEAKQAKLDEQIAALEEAQRKAEEAAALEGGDELDQAEAGQQAIADASDFAGEIIRDLNKAETLPEPAEPEAEAEAEPELTEQEVAAEIETELEREQIQAEAAERYEEQTREALAKQKAEEQAFEARAEEKAAEKEAEVREMEYEAEVEKGAGVAAIEEAGVETKPATTSMGEALRTAQREKKAKKAKGLPARRILEAEKNKPALLEDQRPSTIVVDPEGAARPMTAAELDAQIRRRADLIEQQELDLQVGDKDAPNIPVRVQGLDLEIENPKGSTRSGTDPDGTEWSQTFEGVHYGNIVGVRGADNERLDVYIGEQDWRPKGQKVWVVNQYSPGMDFDEHKVMLGFANEQEAIDAYDRHNGGGMVRGEVVEMSIEEFKTWAMDGKRKSRPLAGPEVLQTATQEDIETMIDRRKPGRKKPKIVFKLGDADISVVEDTASTIVVEGETETMTTGPVTKVQAERGGETAGEIQMQRRGDKMQIVWSYVPRAMRGLALGKRLIVEAVRAANAKGFELISDTSVSVAQLRAYEALRKEGELVVEYSDPVLVREALARGDATEQVEIGGVTPIVKRMFVPEMVEDIVYRQATEAEPEGGFSNQEVREVIDLLLNFMPGINPSKLLIVDDVQDLPMEYFAALAQKDQLNARGFYDKNNDVIAVILGNHPNRSFAIKTFMHEAVGHYGLQKVFGEEMNPLLDDIYANGDQVAIARIADQYGLDLQNVNERRTAVEEYIAHLAESSPSSTLLDRVKNFIRQVLRNAGLLESWTDTDIQFLLRDVRRELRSKPLEKITLTMEAEIEETGEVVTLEQTADVALRRHDKRVAVIERLRECVA